MTYGLLNSGYQKFKGCGGCLSRSMHQLPYFKACQDMFGKNKESQPQLNKRKPLAHRMLNLGNGKLSYILSLPPPPRPLPPKKRPQPRYTGTKTNTTGRRRNSSSRRTSGTTTTSRCNHHQVVTAVCLSVCRSLLLFPFLSDKGRDRGSHGEELSSRDQGRG